MPTTFTVDNEAIANGVSPYNWHRNGSTTIETGNPGAYLRLVFTGTSVGITVDVSRMTAIPYAASIYPVIAYTVDGVRTTRQLTSSDTTITLASSLADTTHTLRIDLIGVDESGVSDRWTIPRMSLVITGVVVDTGKTITQARKQQGGYMICYGDSITEGSAALTTPGVYAQVMDATVGYQQLVANYFQMEYGNVAFAWQEWTATSQGIAGLATAYNQLFNGQARSFTPPPHIATCNMGRNGTVTAATVTTFLTNLRAAVGPRCQIILILPFSQTNATAINTGFSDYQTANPTDSFVQKIDLGSTGSSTLSANSFDGIHPNQKGYDLLAQQIIPLITPILKAGTPNGGLR